MNSHQPTSAAKDQRKNKGKQNADNSLAHLYPTDFDSYGNPQVDGELHEMEKENSHGLEFGEVDTDGTIVHFALKQKLSLIGLNLLKARALSRADDMDAVLSPHRPRREDNQYGLSCPSLQPPSIMEGLLLEKTAAMIHDCVDGNGGASLGDLAVNVVNPAGCPNLPTGEDAGHAAQIMRVPCATSPFLTAVAADIRPMQTSNEPVETLGR